jgi:hypothetical protein
MIADMTDCRVERCGSDAYHEHTLRWLDQGVEISTNVAVCGAHRDQLDEADASWILTPDGKLRIGQGQRDLNEYVLLDKPVVEIGGGPGHLARPDPFGLHLRLKVQERGREAETPPMTLVVPVNLLRGLVDQLQAAINLLEEFEQI